MSWSYIPKFKFTLLGNEGRKDPAKEFFISSTVGKRTLISPEFLQAVICFLGRVYDFN